MPLYDPFTTSCGPGYSDNKFQDSVNEFDNPPSNNRDANCQIHDADTKNCAGDTECLEQIDRDYLVNNVITNPSPLGVVYALGVNASNNIGRITHGRDSLSNEAGGTYEDYGDLAGDSSYFPAGVSASMNANAVYAPAGAAVGEKPAILNLRGNFDTSNTVSPSDSTTANMPYNPSAGVQAPSAVGDFKGSVPIVNDKSSFGMFAPGDIQPSIGGGDAAPGISAGEYCPAGMDGIDNASAPHGSNAESEGGFRIMRWVPFSFAGKNQHLIQLKRTKKKNKYHKKNRIYMK